MLLPSLWCILFLREAVLQLDFPSFFHLNDSSGFLCYYERFIIWKKNEHCRRYLFLSLSIYVLFRIILWYQQFYWKWPQIKMADYNFAAPLAESLSYKLKLASQSIDCFTIIMHQWSLLNHNCLLSLLIFLLPFCCMLLFGGYFFRLLNAARNIQLYILYRMCTINLILHIFTHYWFILFND